MQIMKIFYFTGLLIFLSGCNNIQNDKRSIENSSDKLSLQDTIINSSPQNQNINMDTVDTSQIFEIRSYKDILDLFDELDYTPETWQAGIRLVPRVFIINVGERWGNSTTKEISVEYKKRIFFRGLAPLILRSNELIMKDRNRLEKIRSGFSRSNKISETDMKWIHRLATLYKVDSDENELSSEMIDELWKRVDIIPASLALSQGATESGWGTSRFAAAGNALYGQWTWGKDAMIPEEQRKGLGNYGIAAFGSILESVSAYMLNLNTHNAYADLRNKRAELREKGEKITGYILAEQLTRYSERGQSYVNSIKSMMDFNQLNPVDDAFLSNDPPMYLIPVSDE